MAKFACFTRLKLLSTAQNFSLTKDRPERSQLKMSPMQWLYRQLWRLMHYLCSAILTPGEGQNVNGRKTDWIQGKAEDPSCRSLDLEEEEGWAPVLRSMLYKILCAIQRGTWMWVLLSWRYQLLFFVSFLPSAHIEWWMDMVAIFLKTSLVPFSGAQVSFIPRWGFGVVASS